MNKPSLDELRALILRHAGKDKKTVLGIIGLFMAVEPGPTLPGESLIAPGFSLIAQGAKHVTIGGQFFEYRAGQCLVMSAHPIGAYVAEATPELPFLGFRMLLRPEIISSLLLESDQAQSAVVDHNGSAFSDLSHALVESVVRLLRLLDRPADVPILLASIEREILWRLINGPQATTVRQIGLSDSRLSNIGRAVRWLQMHFAEPIRIESLAAVADMSVTSLHRHFRLVTSMAPIQYQKTLRLQAARARLMATGEGIAKVAFAVGYESAPQFSREYKRMYGKSPRQDYADLKSGSQSLPHLIKQ